MKKLIFPLLVALFVSFTMVASADGPPPPPGNPATGGGGGDPVGAPIDGGLGILLTLGIAYGGIKIFQALKAKQEDAKEEAEARG